MINTAHFNTAQPHRQLSEKVNKFLQSNGFSMISIRFKCHKDKITKTKVRKCIVLYDDNISTNN